jgi:HPt (histidine-containing phosphotransfer) domain-containing protein
MGDGEKARPIHSSRADDPAFDEAIDAFVVSVAERIDELQDAESEGDLAQLASLARGLAVDAEAVGYEILAEAARRVETAALQEKPERAHGELVELTEIARRVRLGHRGAL